MAVGGHGHPDPCAADQDAEVALARDERSGEVVGEVGVVHRIAVHGPEVEDIVAGVAGTLAEHLLVVETGVIGGYQDAHCRLLPALPTGRADHGWYYALPTVVSMRSSGRYGVALDCQSGPPTARASDLRP